MASELNPQDRQALDAVLAKKPNEITESDKALLRARRSYLTEAERKRYGVKTQKAENQGTSTHTENGENASQGGDGGDEQSAYAQLSRQDLVQLAKQRGVKANGKSDDIIAALEAQDAENATE